MAGLGQWSSRGYGGETMGRVPLRLLVVEDDDSVRTALRMGLEDEGYDVVDVADAITALSLVAASPPDLLVVDLMLGEVSGLDCIREVRRTSEVPILVLTARDDTHDVVAGLEAGADDYVTKPYQLKELAARLRALHRRSQLLPTREKEDGVLLDGRDPLAPLVLWPLEGRLTRGQEEVHLTYTELMILTQLASARGKVLSRAQLLEGVRAEDFFGDERLVDVHVRRLRTKVERNAGSPELLTTVRGLGYRLDRC